ncbi:hypothetical protein GOV14_03585 [Candidatus Pacearchaeota archaeon]|nr:hypothetical protein [Candidatus Pacearchaeota archaeon]
MSILTIILFFLYSWGFGFTITSFVKNSDNFLERNLMRIGIGLGVLPLLGVVLNLLHIPLDWRIFLALSLLFPLLYLMKNYKKLEFNEFKLKIKKSDIAILIVLLLFSLTLFMYATGAFSYPYFEDHDPYIHALTAKYVSVEKTILDPPTYDFPYIDPYPPAYALIMGLMHQTSPSIMWTLKFFNALIISLGIIFFYFFAKEFIGNRNKALFATFVLAAIPAYLSHFIWAHSLVPTLFLVGMYCLERMKHDKKWLYPSLFVISVFPLIQPSQAIKIFVLLGIYSIIKSLLNRKLLLKEFIAISGGYLISVLWWYNKLGRQFSSEAKIHSGTEFAKIGLFQKLKNIFPYDGGTGTRAYTFDDFFVASSQNMINNPIGVGVVISVLLIVSLAIILIKYKKLLSKENYWISVTLAWFIFTFLGVNSMTFNLPLGLFAFRFWMLFAIPVALLSVEGSRYIAKIFKEFGVGKMITFTVIIAGIILTSGHQKFDLNTMPWNPPLGGLMQSVEELQGYVALKDLEPNTRVFSFCPDSYINIISFDKSICSWCERENSVIGDKDVASDELYSVMKENDYEYLIVDSSCALNFGINETNEKINEMMALNKFQLAAQNDDFLLFKTV